MGNQICIVMQIQMLMGKQMQTRKGIYTAVRTMSHHGKDMQLAVTDTNTVSSDWEEAHITKNLRTLSRRETHHCH